MRPRSLALLFLVVAGLLTFIWFYERGLPSSDERLELAKRVLRLEADEVLALDLTRGETTVRLERIAGAAGTADEAGERSAWRLAEPLAAPADGLAVDRLVEQLAGVEKQRTLEAPEAAALGLVEPRGRVTLESEGGPIELLIGSAVPASSTLILGVAGRDEAYVVSDGLWRELEKPAGEWRSRDLGPASREAIQRIALGSGEGVALGRRGESFWVESPYVDRADRDLVSALLGEIVGLRVEEFVDDPPAELRLVAGSLEVVLEDREAALRIELGGPAGDGGERRLARVDGQLVELDTGLAEALERPAEEWRSRAWTGLEVYQIDRLTARDAAGETLFERDGGDWLRDGAPVEYEPVSELLYALAGVEAESAAAAGGAAGEPLLTLELSGAEGERQETLTLYPPDGRGLSSARADGREPTLLLAEGVVADLQLKLAEARGAAEPSAEESELEPLAED